MTQIAMGLGAITGTILVTRVTENLKVKGRYPE
jgi:hypothetical protein